MKKKIVTNKQFGILLYNIMHTATAALHVRWSEIGTIPLFNIIYYMRKNN